MPLNIYFFIFLYEHMSMGLWPAAPSKREGMLTLSSEHPLMGSVSATIGWEPSTLRAPMFR